MRYDLDPRIREDLKQHHVREVRSGLAPIVLTPEQIKALAHAIVSDEPVCAGLALYTDIEANTQEPLNRSLVIYAYDDEGWIAVDHVWNEGGSGVWLAPDGGWHYQPGEAGYYPWRNKDKS